ncbi:hypothetical protein PIB30_063121 [Stylosanthes scabra]|uniref:Ankyrin repeat domain-containing protein n=1 Tax=Stylosanthes scabra TaxID=79078 RepID=A0ABU6VJT1_9FABA|nr:hypothetical protein [Stylosanthes scabra]
MASNGASISVAGYSNSHVHKAIIMKDYTTLKEILSSLPKLGNPYEIRSENASRKEEEKADAISAVVNARNVENGDTPLHLCAKLGDLVATDMLMAVDANIHLKNKQGWSALREAIINKRDKIAMSMIKNSWNDLDGKWYRRLPRYAGTLRRMRDFYMEISFHFESSVIPFISKIAPSDTYKIWKKGANLRADMTLAGFDGLKIKRSDQSILFFGEGSEDAKRYPGSLCVLSHKKKELILTSRSPWPVTPTDKEVRQVLARKYRDNKVVSVAIDVSQAVLVPQLTWRRKERKESVGPWKAKVYDMQNVVLSVKSRSIPGAPPDTELACRQSNKEQTNKELDEVLTPEERKQFELAMNNSKEDNHNHKVHGKKEKKGRFGGHKEKGKKSSASSGGGSSNGGANNGNGNGSDEVFKKGMSPSLWLSQNYPLKIEELLPLLDILSEKVKAVRRVREVLTTKLPKDSFPVKVSIPVISTVRVLVTFAKFEELHNTDEFESAPSSPASAEGEGEDDNNPPLTQSTSWFQWIKAPSRSSSSVDNSSIIDDSQDLFAIPPDYKVTTFDEKLNNMEKKRAAKVQEQKSQPK